MSQHPGLERIAGSVNAQGLGSSLMAQGEPRRERRPVRKINLDVSMDLMTTRLIKLCQAAQLTGALPEASAKALVQLAKGVRAYAEAGELALARLAVQEIGAAVPSEDFPDLAAALKRHAERVLSTLH